MHYCYSLHGHAVTISSSPEQGGPADGVCRNFPREGADRGDQETRHVWGTAFAGGESGFEWYRIPCPIPHGAAGWPPAIARFEVLVNVEGKAYIDRVHLGDHAQAVFTEADLRVVTNYEKCFAGSVPVAGLFSIYLRVSFQGPATVSFRGANIALAGCTDARTLCP